MITTSPVDAIDLAEQFKLLSNPKRLQIIHLLMEGVHCNCELGKDLDMSPNLISHHLGLLRKAGLVEIERDAVDARWIYYSLNEAKLEVLLQTFQAFLDPAKIKPRRPVCGPQNAIIYSDEFFVVEN